MRGPGAGPRAVCLVAIVAVAVGGRPVAGESAPRQRPTARSGTAPKAPDACLGKPHCSAAGPFLAEVAGVTSSRSGKRNVVRTTLRFVNLSDHPIILGYKARSGAVVDELGNQYANEGSDRNRVSGIGYVGPSEADPQLVLAPGEGRTASFESRLTLYRGTRLGTEWSYALTITLLEVLPGGRVRAVREYPVEFTSLTATS